MYGFPESLTQPGMGGVETSAEQHTRLLKALHGLAVSINAEKARGNVEGVKALRATFEDVAQQYRALGDTDLTGFDRFLLGIDEWVTESVKAGKNLVKNTVDFLGDTAQSTLLKVALPVALILGAALFFQGKFTSRRR